MGVRRCKACGNPLPKWANARMVYCPECAYKRIQARNKEERDYFLQHGICTRC